MNNGVKIGFRVWMYYGLTMLLALLFLSSMTGWILYILNVCLLFAFGLLVYNDGGYQGEKAATTLATLEKQRAEGHVIDSMMEKQSFNKKHAIGIFLVSALPLLILASANLACESFYPEVDLTSTEEEAIVEEVTSEEEENRYDEDAFPEADVELTESEPISRWMYLMVVTRAFFMPFLSLYSLLPTHLLYVSFLPLSLVYPICSVVGYLSGPSLRRQKLEAIEKGKKRKMRNLKVNKKPRTPKTMKPEV